MNYRNDGLLIYKSIATQKVLLFELPLYLLNPQDKVNQEKCRVGADGKLQKHFSHFPSLTTFSLQGTSNKIYNSIKALDRKYF